MNIQNVCKSHPEHTLSLTMYMPYMCSAVCRALSVPYFSFSVSSCISDIVGLHFIYVYIYLLYTWAVLSLIRIFYFYFPSFPPTRKLFGSLYCVPVFETYRCFSCKVATVIVSWMPIFLSLSWNKKVLTVIQYWFLRWNAANPASKWIVCYFYQHMIYSIELIDIIIWVMVSERVDELTRKIKAK